MIMFEYIGSKRPFLYIKNNHPALDLSGSLINRIPYGYITNEVEKIEQLLLKILRDKSNQNLNSFSTLEFSFEKSAKLLHDYIVKNFHENGLNIK